jgi:hypothetical protein
MRHSLVALPPSYCILLRQPTAKQTQIYKQWQLEAVLAHNFVAIRDCAEGVQDGRHIGQRVSC